MFERYTEEARQTILSAQGEGRRLKHGYIGTEHLLLGLLAGDKTIASEVLLAHELDLEWGRRVVVQIVGTGETESTQQIPFTPRAKKVLELALREALALGHNYIGPAHILLGLLREHGGVAFRMLAEVGLLWERVHQEVVRAITNSTTPAGVPSGAMEVVSAQYTRIKELEAQLRELEVLAAARAHDLEHLEALEARVIALVFVLLRDDVPFGVIEKHVAALEDHGPFGYPRTSPAAEVAERFVQRLERPFSSATHDFTLGVE